MSSTVNLYEAKTHLSQLVERAAAGEEIIIAKAGRPVARLMPLPAPSVSRVPGALKGQIWISDDFDDPLPPDILAAFNGEAAGDEVS
jgi:prevent-host-death family protein